DADTGTWELFSGGNIVNGVVDTSDGSVLRVTGGGDLTNVTVAGTVEVVSALDIVGGITIDGTLALQNGTASTTGGVLLGGTGTIVATGNSPVLNATNGVSTIGPDLTVIGQTSFQFLLNQFQGGEWVNQGAIVAQTSVMRVPGTWTNEGSVVCASGAAIDVTAPLTTNAGVLRVEPGATVTIDALVQTRTGVVELDVTGTSPAQYGSLSVDTNASLDGALVLRFLAPFVPTAGDAFDAMAWSSFDGVFADVSGIDLPVGLALDPAYDGAGLTVTVIGAGTR
ncbi:MAG: hypothetical protein ACYTGR_07050, partial [Planctomycetota bacterium]